MRLTPGGMRKFVAQFGRRLDAPVKTRELNRALSYRKHLEVQARKMARLILGQAERYTPFKSH